MLQSVRYFKRFQSSLQIYHQRLIHSDPKTSRLTWMSKGDSEAQNSVIVLGWAGSKQEHVKKYTDFFAENFKLNTFGAILSMPDLMSYDQPAQSEFARKVLEEVSDSGSNSKLPHGLIILSLSNNGATVYPHLVQLCKKNVNFSQKFSIRGAIFDSGPGPLSWPAYMLCGLNLGGHDGIQSLVTPTVSNQKKLFRPIAPILLNFYVDQLDPAKDFWASLKEATDVSRRFKTNWVRFSKEHPWPGEYMLTEQETWPLLFLYSTKDQMMPASFIRRVIEVQKWKKNRLVQSHDFETSPHVAHLRYQPENYKKQIEPFLKLV